MKISLALLTAVLNGLAVADSRVPNTSFICERSDASPYLHNVNEMIGNLNDASAGENVCNSGPVNGCGDTWTGYSGEGGAAFMVCGPGMRCSGDPGGMPCTGAGCGGIFAKFIGEDLESLRDECQGPDSDGDIRVGGRVVYEVSDDSDLDSDELKLFSKPG
ncbi:hypothetical protein PENSTE_c005G01586 [Penicillium steckii]|uniref:Cyanovirin-N domain-containing protein n=1 Tax=Penicillium steckii TaxID=303698 RepID=A0A1V6TKA5_9EURO|nr:hypothetical protein PENSTE_c005G01586 [Penicillium steckii]